MTLTNVITHAQGLVLWQVLNQDIVGYSKPKAREHYTLDPYLAVCWMHMHRNGLTLTWAPFTLAIIVEENGHFGHPAAGRFT